MNVWPNTSFSGAIFVLGLVVFSIESFAAERVAPGCSGISKVEMSRRLEAVVTAEEADSRRTSALIMLLSREKVAPASGCGSCGSGEDGKKEKVVARRSDK